MAFDPDGQRGSSPVQKMERQLFGMRRAARGNEYSRGAVLLIKSVAFSPDGQQILGGGSDDSATLWDKKTGNVLHVLTGHGDSVESAGFSHDGRIAITGSMDGTAAIWDTASGKLVRKFDGAGSDVRSVAISPDGKLLAAISSEGTIVLWDATTGSDCKEDRATL